MEDSMIEQLSVGEKIVHCRYGAGVVVDVGSMIKINSPSGIM